jgi:hypothetical protein
VFKEAISEFRDMFVKNKNEVEMRRIRMIAESTRVVVETAMNRI